MAKEKKTRQELSKIVIDRLGISGATVAIHKNEIFGWDVTIVVVPPGTNPHLMLHEVISDLRDRFDLQD